MMNMNFKRFTQGVYRRVPKAIKENRTFLRANLKVSETLSKLGVENPLSAYSGPEYWESCSTDGVGHSPRLYTEPDMVTHELLDDLIEVVPASASFLDIGCNAGRNLKYLYDREFRDLGGIDINRESIDVVFKEKYPDVHAASWLAVGNAAEEIKQVSSERYDVVFSAGVLSFIEPRDKSLFADMVRVSKKYIAVFAQENAPHSLGWNFQHVFESLGCTMISYKLFYDLQSSKEMPRLSNVAYDRDKHFWSHQALRIFIKNQER